MSRFVALRLLCWIQVGNLTRLEHCAQCQILQFQDQDRQRRAEIILYTRPTPIRQASTMSLQVTVMIAAFVVATISPSVAFQTEPPPILTTIPATITSVTRPPCSFGGMQVEGLVPGSTVQEGCVIFTCDYGGYVERVFEHCSVLGEFLCVDPIHGKCCSTCPNGKGLKHRAWSLTHSPYIPTGTYRQTDM